MNRNGGCRQLVRLWLFVGLLCVMDQPCVAQIFDEYQIRPELQFTFPDVSLPNRAQAPTVFDVLGDGRILAVTTVDADDQPQAGGPATPQLFVQSTVGSTTFDLIGTLPLAGGDWSDFGGTMLTVSPDGTRAAVGENSGRIGVFSTAGLNAGGPVPTVAWFGVENNDAAWLDSQLLGVTRFNSSTNVSETVILDTSSEPSSPDVETIITGMDASSGIAFDSSGSLFTAEGADFLSGGAPTGQVRRFERSLWENARASGTPLDFPVSGSEVTTFLSAASLDFDRDGNLIIGGARFDATPIQSNAFGVFRDSLLREFDPNDMNNQNGNFYTVTVNRVTDQIYANEPFAVVFGAEVDSRAIYVIGVPEPPTFALVLLGIVGLLGFRHRVTK